MQIFNRRFVVAYTTRFADLCSQDFDAMLVAVNDNAPFLAPLITIMLGSHSFLPRCDDKHRQLLMNVAKFSSIAGGLVKLPTMIGPIIQSLSLGHQITPSIFKTLEQHFPLLFQFLSANPEPSQQVPIYLRRLLAAIASKCDLLGLSGTNDRSC